MEKAKSTNLALRRMRVAYICASVVLLGLIFGGVAIYDSQESCSVKTTTQTESGYYKSGPQNWNNSRYDYQVPVTKSTCSTRAEDGGSAMPVAFVISLILIAGYFFLPKLNGYLKN